jgi:YVTN family beta-propeller protein
MTDLNGRQAARDGGNDRVLELEAAPVDAIVVEIPVHQGPISGIAVSPDGSRLMVTYYGHDSVSVVDTDTCRVVQTVDGVNEPHALAALTSRSWTPPRTRSR